MHIWLRLKPELLPCVSQETDKFIQEYQGKLLKLSSLLITHKFSLINIKMEKEI